MSNEWNDKLHDYLIDQGYIHPDILQGKCIELRDAMRELFNHEIELLNLIPDDIVESYGGSDNPFWKSIMVQGRISRIIEEIDNGS